MRKTNFTQTATNLKAAGYVVPPCVNLDGVVDQKDVDQFNYWANVTTMNSSWYDFNLDGFTNQYDVPFITQGTFPRVCPRPAPV